MATISKNYSSNANFEENNDDLKVSSGGHKLVPARHDLSFYFEESSIGLGAHVFYDAQLFNKQWVERLCLNLVELMRSGLEKNVRLNSMNCITQK